MTLSKIILIPTFCLWLAACDEDKSPNPVITEPTSFKGVNFGTDFGDWANDNECDDKRFVGEGMTETSLLASDVLRDASDCLYLFKQGAIKLR